MACVRQHGMLCCIPTDFLLKACNAKSLSTLSLEIIEKFVEKIKDEYREIF
jgi:hypothetical protein